LKAMPSNFGSMLTVPPPAAMRSAKASISARSVTLSRESMGPS